MILVKFDLIRFDSDFLPDAYDIDEIEVVCTQSTNEEESLVVFRKDDLITYLRSQVWDLVEEDKWYRVSGQVTATACEENHTVELRWTNIMAWHGNDEDDVSDYTLNHHNEETPVVN